MSKARPQSVERQIKRGHLILAVVGQEKDGSLKWQHIHKKDAVYTDILDQRVYKFRGIKIDHDALDKFMDSKKEEK